MKYTCLVKSGSAKEGIEPQPDGSLIIRTHARAHDGEANSDIVRLLSKHFKISKSQITIVNGLKNRHKIIEILD